MKKPKMSTVHSFELRPRKGAEGKLTVGANTELWMDGVKMKGVRSANIAISAAGVAVLTLEVYGAFHVIGQFEPNITAV
jgi:hypothetical protein